MDEEIKIGYDMAEIEGKSADEKLNILLRIAFSNHKCLKQHSQVIYGNGKPGICDSVRQQGKALTALWSVFLLAVGGLSGWLLMLAIRIGEIK